MQKLSNGRPTRWSLHEMTTIDSMDDRSRSRALVCSGVKFEGIARKAIAFLIGVKSLHCIGQCVSLRVDRRCALVRENPASPSRALDQVNAAGFASKHSAHNYKTLRQNSRAKTTDTTTSRGSTWRPTQPADCWSYLVSKSEGQMALSVRDMRAASPIR